MSELITRKTAMSANLVSFCRYLRSHGFGIGPAEEADALRALTAVPFADPDTFQLTLRAVIPRSRVLQEKFDDLYTTYWREWEKAIDSKVKGGEGEQGKSHVEKKGPNKQSSLKALKSWLYGEPSDEETEIAAYSSTQVLTRKDFSAFTEEEREEVLNIIARIARTLALRYNRRFQPTRSHWNFDLRRTMRQNMRQGGEIISLAHRKRKVQKLRLVMLCDVSKSMDLYSRFLVQFIYAFQTAYQHIETFVFSTSLHRVTHQLREREFEKALGNLRDSVNNWSGGTNIGGSLTEFVENHGSRMLSSQTVVLILSDGWDTGEVEMLESSMRAIQRKAAKVIWLNPLAGNPAFEPTVKGMEAAMPFIDVFAPVHNVDSLRKIVASLL